jgi:hypothetical protein
VTVIAGQQGVLAFKPEFCIARMIESCVIPGHRAMTVFTLLTATTFMKIVIRMAAEAGSLRNLQGLVFVAVGAGDFQVIAD